MNQTEFYSLYAGDQWEGGGVLYNFTTSELAMKAAEMLVKSKQAKVNKTWAGEENELQKRQYDWVKIDTLPEVPDSKIVALWQNSIEEVMVYKEIALNEIPEDL
jgi:hypothetical protein